MVSRNRIQFRTAKKRKAWAVYSFDETPTPLGTSPHQPIDLLSTAMTELGINHQPGLTVMRVVGNLCLTESNTVQNAVADYGMLSVGLAWVPSLVTAKANGDTAIPVPLEGGLRETRWYWQGNLGPVIPQTASLIGNNPLTPYEMNNITVDTSNRQSSKVASEDFVAIFATQNESWTTSAVQVSGVLNILLALP